MCLLSSQVIWQVWIKRLALAIVVSTGFTGQTVWSIEHSGLAASGKQFYYQGTRSNSTEVTAYVGRAAIAMPASTLPCVGCHGRDGKGNSEGGVKPSNITWSYLSKAYGGTSKSGRHFGTYDEDSFLRVLTEGVDAAGNQLDASMPRYNISRHDARNLIAYLKNIENDYDPGISENEIVFATLQPGKGWQARMGQLITSTLQAYFDDINQQGGVYGRNLSLKTVMYSDSKNFSRHAKEIIDSDEAFALLASFSGNLDQTLTDLAENAQIPSVAPYTNYLTAKGDEHRYTFYIYGGLEAQVKALLKRAVDDNNKIQNIFVLYRENGAHAKSAEDAYAFLQQQGITNVRLIAYRIDSQAWLGQLPKKKSSMAKVLVLGSTRDLLHISSAWNDKLDPETIYMPGMFVSSEILQLPSDIAEKLELAYHSIPDSGELNDFYRFMREHKFGVSGMSVRLFAYSAARIMVEGLNRAGKRVSREKTIAALESLYDFDAGLNRPVRFGGSRRVSVLGAYIVKMDKVNKSLKATGNWVALD